MIGLLLFIIAGCLLFGAAKVRGVLATIAISVSIALILFGIAMIGNWLFGGDGGMWFLIVAFGALAVWGFLDPVVGGRCK